ncbi:MAG: hypothetical protein MUD12_04325 [Spirochaetes bacterium]|jgi:hypothetical protein|nr:hypothetical protein [Spirochaetota bacterium]
MKKIFFAVFIAAALLSGSVAGEKAVWIKSIIASSVLNPEKGAYDQGNIMDLTDESWCEGKKDEGTGEGVLIRLSSFVPVKKLYVKNGMGLSKYWEANNRVKEISINGSKYTLKDSPGFQEVGLSGRAVDSLDLKILLVYRGSKWNDTCIAEVALSDPGKEFNRPDDYVKIADKNWETAGDMPGSMITFSRGFVFTSDVVPCGDETCPNTTRGGCRRLQANRYECRYLENCRGTYDPRLNRAGRVCTQSNDGFVLEISGDAPEITYNGKKTRLAPFN